MPVPPRGTKIARFQQCLPLFEAGNVVIPHPSLYPWVEQELLLELLSFPQLESGHDDIVDSVSMGLVEGNRRFGATAGFAGERAGICF